MASPLPLPSSPGLAALLSSLTALGGKAVPRTNDTMGATDRSTKYAATPPPALLEFAPQEYVARRSMSPSGAGFGQASPERSRLFTPERTDRCLHMSSPGRDRAGLALPDFASAKEARAAYFSPDKPIKPGSLPVQLREDAQRRCAQEAEAEAMSYEETKLHEQSARDSWVALEKELKRRAEVQDRIQEMQSNLIASQFVEGDNVADEWERTQRNLQENQITIRVLKAKLQEHERSAGLLQTRQSQGQYAKELESEEMLAAQVEKVQAQEELNELQDRMKNLNIMIAGAAENERRMKMLDAQIEKLKQTSQKWLSDIEEADRQIVKMSRNLSLAHSQEILQNENPTFDR